MDRAGNDVHERPLPPVVFAPSLGTLPHQLLVCLRLVRGRKVGQVVEWNDYWMMTVIAYGVVNIRLLGVYLLV